MIADAVLSELAVEVELITQTHSLAVLVLGDSSFVHIITDDPPGLNLFLPSTLPIDTCTSIINNCLAGPSIGVSISMSVSMSISMSVSTTVSMPVSVSISLPTGMRVGISVVCAISIVVGLTLDHTALELKQMAESKV